LTIPKKVTTIAQISTLDKEVDEVAEREDFPEVGAEEEKVEIRHKRTVGKLLFRLNRSSRTNFRILFHAPMPWARLLPSGLRNKPLRELPMIPVRLLLMRSLMFIDPPEPARLFIRQRRTPRELAHL